MGKMKNMAGGFVGSLMQTSRHNMAFGLALCGLALMLALLFAPVVRNTLDVAAALGGRRGNDVSANMQAASAGNEFRALARAINISIEDTVDRLDLSRSDRRRQTEDMRDDFEIGAIQTGAAVFTVIGVLSALAALATGAAMYMLVIRHEFGTLASFAAAGLGALTNIVALIGIPIVNGAIDDTNNWRTSYDLSHSLWMWLALLVSAGACFLVFNLSRTDPRS